MNDEIFISHFKTPLGWLEIVGTENAIQEVQFHNEQPYAHSLYIPKSLQECQIQLEEYFLCKRKEFDVHLNPQGTAFQLNVWQKLLKIPLGNTASYLDIAHTLGDPNATRAVGSANGQNPIAIIIPCHRVIGSNGTLTGYAGGLWRKKWLLNHERMMSGAPVQLSMFG